MENKDLSRYEEVQKKQNPFVKALKAFGTYLKFVVRDFIASFKYNNMKLAGWLIAIPGVFIGFFLEFHYVCVSQMSFKVIDPETFEPYEYIGFDYTGIVFFILMLFGILNIFTAASVMKKKNLGSVIVATITSAVILIMGGLYLGAIFIYNGLVVSGEIAPASGDWTLTGDTNFMMAIITVVVSILSSVVGVVLAFIKYDRTYEKVDR
jgi:hypothetical protein